MRRLVWPGRESPADDGRWIVLDVETSGLDPTRDRLLAIAGLSVRRPGAGELRLDLGDSFEVVLRQDDAPLDKANILLHGIGVGAQRAGMDRAEALDAFAAWVGQSPLIAFHAAFDETMIRRALKAAGRPPLRNAWADLAPVAEVARPDVRAKSLDEWLAHFGIEVAERHQAAADTLATAELLQRLWPHVCAQHPEAGFQALREMARQRRWLGAS